MTKWNDIIGHDWAIEVLASAIEHQRVGHAYLISGPTQVGKGTLARTFAMALNCSAENKVDRPCGNCRSCQFIQANRHPDVVEVEPTYNARGKPTLKIDVMRELQRSLQLGTFESPYKIAIIHQFDSATIGAANAFLKTLEEPPSNVVLILTTTEADNLLDTIKSRCRVVGIRPIPTPIIEQALVTRWNLPQAKATRLAHLANGRLGWAVAAAQNEAIVEAHDGIVAILKQVMGANHVERFQLADKMARQPEKLSVILNTWVSWWRDLMLITLGQVGKNGIAHLDELPELETFSKRWDKTHIQTSLKQTQDAIWQIEANANTRLVLENLFLTYPKN